MSKKIIIHAGFPKSGTTALQASLNEYKKSLRDQGIVYSTAWNNAHHRPAWAVMGYVFGWEGKGGSTTPISVWEKFVRQIKKSKKTFLISSEFFSHAPKEVVQRIHDDLAADDIEIIFTLRPFAKILPSRYQQSLKKGKKWTYEEWLSKVFSEVSTHQDDSYMIDYAGILKTWADVFGQENVTLVLTDETNPDNLYRRFEQAVGISSNTLQVATTKKLNRSLTGSEVSILRAVNERKPKKWKWDQYRYFIRGNFVKYLSDHPSKFPQDPKLELPNSSLDNLATYAKSQIAQIDSLGIQILGNSSELHVDASRSEFEYKFDMVPVEMVADLVIHLSSISRLAGTSTRTLIQELGIRLTRSPKFYVRLPGHIITRIFK